MQVNTLWNTFIIKKRYKVKLKPPLTHLQKKKKLLAQKNILDEEQFNNKINELKNEIINSNNENNKKLKKINNERDKVTKSF